MRIAVTGSSKLGGAIAQRFGATVLRVEQQADFNDFDVFVNNAHIDFCQTDLLARWFGVWCNDPTKMIINISSRAGLSNLSKGYMYAAQKAALDHMADNLIYNSNKKCRITTIGLGMMEENLPSLKYSEVCDLIDYVVHLPQHLEIPRIYLQHSHNYQDIQRLKSSWYT